MEERVDNIQKASKEKNMYLHARKRIPVKGGVTRNQLMEKFHLSEKNQLRPLIAVLKNLDLIKTGRGFTPLPKLIQLYKLLEDPVEFTKIAHLTNRVEEPLPPKSSGIKRQGVLP